MSPGDRRGPAGNRASSKHLIGCATNGTEPASAAPGPGVDLALDRLTGVKGRQGHWEARCPCHEDSVASLHIDVQPHYGRAAVKMHCKGCGANGDAVLAALGLTAQRGRIYYEGNGCYLVRPPKYVERLSEAYVDRTVAYLHEHPDLLAYVTERRGVSLAVAQRQRIGFDEGRERWVLPVRDADGELVNIRRYDPDAAKDVGKMKNAAGHGAARLYAARPGRRRLAETVLVCEGEWDALAAASHGLRAVTGTHGAGTWRPAWSRALAGHDLLFAFDCDEAGRTNAVRHAANVAEHGGSVRVLDLDPDRDDGWDLSDWFAAGRTARDLLALADSVAPLGETGGGHRG